ncbi:MAG: DUF423 domain-containing protein [Bdellovibrionales bacterium]|nr:DUF423 domain-containing protein [Bdellovibrionales bacterium]
MWIGALACGLAVALGAFGAHALREKLEPRLLEVFQTGVHYQMLHGLALLAFGIWVPGFSASSGQDPRWIGWFFLAGILLFSGSLYALSLSGTRWLGAITPIGGVSFLVAWFGWAAILIQSAVRKS